MIAAAEFVAAQLNHPMFAPFAARDKKKSSRGGNSKSKKINSNNNTSKTKSVREQLQSGAKWIWLGDYIEQIAR